MPSLPANDGESHSYTDVEKHPMSYPPSRTVSRLLLTLIIAIVLLDNIITTFNPPPHATSCVLGSTQPLPFSVRPSLLRSSPSMNMMSWYTRPLVYAQLATLTMVGDTTTPFPCREGNDVVVELEIKPEQLSRLHAMRMSTTVTKTMTRKKTRNMMTNTRKGNVHRRRNTWKRSLLAFIFSRF
ncbi:hypothetical protein BDZ89DRAFT_1073197, partial [Hymenopellis radicata]